LVLVAPQWLRRALGSAAEPVVRELYGFNTFHPLALPGQCQAMRLWGCSCPYGAAPKEADHLFPRSLGGPTIAENRLTLCTWHNKIKSMDPYIFPWEEGLPSWVLGLLEQM